MTPPTPTSRLLKATCPTCGYAVRITKKWANTARPACPVHQQPLAVEGLDETPPPPPAPRVVVTAGTAEWWAQRWLRSATPADVEAMRAALAAI